MAIEVFNRYENKYMINTGTFERMERRLKDYMEPDAYNKEHETYTITNLYYDTPDNHLIRTSLSKPKYKEKLRVRSYGVPDKDQMVYAEIKKKFTGLTNKRRSALKLEEAYEFLETGILPQEQEYMNMQVLREIRCMLEQHRLSPALYLAYDRRAYFGVGEHDLRISFDRNIRSRRSRLALEMGDQGELLIPEDMWLMEIKSAKSIPVWLAGLLAECKVYPTSFSKYGTEYKQMLAAKVPDYSIHYREPFVVRPQNELITA